jgi:hypothetical protein
MPDRAALTEADETFIAGLLQRLDSGKQTPARDVRVLLIIIGRLAREAA